MGGTFRVGQVAYRILGEGAEPALILAGGPLLDSQYLDDLGGLSQHRALAVPDLPRVRVDEVLPVVEAVREDTGQGRVDLIAHSAGASAAMCYVAARPHQVRRLVLITPGVSLVGVAPDEEGVESVLASRRDEPGFAAAIEARHHDPTSLEAQRVSFGAWGTAQRRLAEASLVDRLDRLQVYYSEPRPQPARLQAAARAFDRPVTIVRGEVDVHPTRRQAEELAELFPKARVVSMAGSAHYPWLDNPEKFVDVVLDGLAA